MTAVLIDKTVKLSAVSQALKGSGFNEIMYRTCDSFISCRLKDVGEVDVVVVIKDGMKRSAVKKICCILSRYNTPMVFW